MQIASHQTNESYVTLGQLGRYVGGSAKVFRCPKPDKAPGSTITVAADGRLYDCDFNQMLELPLGTGAASGDGSVSAASGSGEAGEHPLTIANLQRTVLIDAPIDWGNHCYGCTAGQGSSCAGATAGAATRASTAAATTTG